MDLQPNIQAPAPNALSDWWAQTAARNASAAVLTSAFPHLVPVSEQMHSLKAAAKNIRIELKRAFPKVRFSVKTSRFSGGDAIDVRWTDGPVADQVELIVGRYTAGHFDGMEDLYVYQRSAWKDAFGDAKYIHCHREDSDPALESAVRTVRAKYAGNLRERGISEIRIEDLRAGRLYQVEVMTGASLSHWGLQSLVYRTAAQRTWALTQRDWLPLAKVQGGDEAAQDQDAEVTA